MLTELIDKVILVLKPVIEDSLLFLVEFYLKPVLGYTSEIGYCKVDLYNIRDELYWVSTEVEVALKQKFI